MRICGAPFPHEPRTICWSTGERRHLIPAGTGIYRYNDVDFGAQPEAGAPAAEPAAAPEVAAASEVATIVA